MTDPADDLASFGARWEYLIRRMFDVPDIVGPEAAWDHVTSLMAADTTRPDCTESTSRRDAGLVLASTLHHASRGRLDPIVLGHWHNNVSDGLIDRIAGDATVGGNGSALARSVLRRLFEHRSISNDLAGERAVHLVPPEDMREAIGQLRGRWQ